MSLDQFNRTARDHKIRRQIAEENRREHPDKDRHPAHVRDRDAVNLPGLARTIDNPVFDRQLAHQRGHEDRHEKRDNEHPQVPVKDLHRGLTHNALPPNLKRTDGALLEQRSRLSQKRGEVQSHGVPNGSKTLFMIGRTTFKRAGDIEDRLCQ